MYRCHYTSDEYTSEYQASFNRPSSSGGEPTRSVKTDKSHSHSILKSRRPHLETEKDTVIYAPKHQATKIVVTFAQPIPPPLVIPRRSKSKPLHPPIKQQRMSHTSSESSNLHQSTRTGRHRHTRRESNRFRDSNFIGGGGDTANTSLDAHLLEMLVFKPELVSVSPSLLQKLTNINYYTALFRVASNSTFNRGGGGDASVRINDWKWNDDTFVRLPLSSCFYKNYIDRVECVPKQMMRWEMVQQELKKLESFCESVNRDGSEFLIGSVIGARLTKYNPKYALDCNFGILNNPELQNRLVSSLPALIDHALRLESRLASPIPILRRDHPHTLYLTRNLACSLLANAFFCTYPDQHGDRDMPDFNFFRLFHQSDDEEQNQLKIEKLKCLLEYFSHIDQDQDKHNIISYERRVLASHCNWASSTSKFCPVEIRTGEGIEQAEGMLQVDFANRRVGGGVLGGGMVMEEIRFCLSPELIVARLFTEALGPNEVLVVTGTKQFSSYSGYGSSFRFSPKSGGYGPSARDELHREYTQVVAMDALHFKVGEAWQQFRKTAIDRELGKCNVGFFHGRKNVSPIATGNWGCGVFNGDAQLKFLIQWMAASELNRPAMVFHTSNSVQYSSIRNLLSVVYKNNNMTVGKMYKCLMKYEEKTNIWSALRLPLFSYIEDCCISGSGCSSWFDWRK